MRLTLLTALAAALLAGTALAGLVDDQGQVVGWGLTPFTQPNQMDTFDGSVWKTIQNDYAPIDFPGGVGYVPSPGGSTGEKFDLEEMHLRMTGDVFQLLLVSSKGATARAAGSTWFLGDLMLTFGGERFGVVTIDQTAGLTPGAVYRILSDSDTLPLQDLPRGYADDTHVVANDLGPDGTVAEIIGPFALAGDIPDDQFLGLAAVETDVFDYGGKEDGTHLVQYTFDTSLLGFTEPPDDWTAQIAWGCGNDVIRVHGQQPYIPEPATLGMLLVGVALTLWTRRRRTA